MNPARSGARRPLKWLLPLAACVVVAALALLLVFSGIASPFLSSWTGEEDPREQIKGVGAWLWLRLQHGAPETAPYTPMPHTGLNPFGINTFLEQEVEPAKVELSMQMISAAGFRWIRQEFPWEDIEISGKGDYWDHKWDQSAWAKYDRIVDLAERNGLRIIARLDNPPAWSRAAGDEAGTLAPPDRLEDFGDYVHAVVSRYRGRVRYYQIWNEPNIYPEWGEQPVDARAYVELLKVAYTRAKEADPDCVILSAGLAQTAETGPRNLDDTIYLQQMYDAGVQGYFDIMGVMAYGLWTGPGDQRLSQDRTNFSRPQLIREIMVRNGDADKPIWATEIGWNALPTDFAGPANFGRVTQPKQARYAVQAYERAQRDWPWMGVMNFWFFKRATDQETSQTFYYFRMVEPDFTPLPVYEAMRDYANRAPMVPIGYHQEDHWALSYGGEWVDLDDAQAVLGRLRQAQGQATLAFTFRGTDLELVTRQGPESGSLAVRLDGRALPTISLKAAQPLHQQRITLAQGLRDGAHTVELACLGDGPVAIDGLIVRRTARYWQRVLGQSAALIGAAVVGLAGLAWLGRRRRSGAGSRHD
ncbi:MAG: cellulase family glycosylhydrolase [Chloroflexi bacterium]|nr:cellulase family glycosylhydrolase [Chloroflexota bacterium]